LLAGFVTSSVASQGPNCPPCGSGQTQLSQAEAQQQLDLHNQFRHAVHGTTDHDLEWNCDLMCQAQVVGDTCTFQHSGSYGSAIQAGENLATGTDGELAAWLWFQEYTAYDVPQYKSGVGHYTAMIWKSSGDLGCGVCRSSSAGQRTIYVCQYANGPANFGFQGTNYYAENAPVFHGTKQGYNNAGIPCTMISNALCAELFAAEEAITAAYSFIVFGEIKICEGRVHLPDGHKHFLSFDGAVPNQNQSMQPQVKYLL